MVLTSDLC